MSGGVIADFLEQLRACRRGFLLLDYDGTLAPFVADRLRAKPDPVAISLLSRILRAGSTRVAFVTGRPALELRALLNLAGTCEIWGCHGFEHLRRDGVLQAAPLHATVRRALITAEAEALRNLPASRIERKRGSVALHVRGLAPDTAARALAQVRAVWEPLREIEGLALREFDGGLELCAVARNKGHAVEALLADDDAKSRLPAYLGDDGTDEDAFRAMKNRGLSLLVRNEPRPTIADARIPMPRGVHEFLSAWHAAAAPGEVAP